MPEFPVNKPLSPGEAVDALCHIVEGYVAKGTCGVCALKLACAETGVPYRQAAYFWVTHRCKSDLVAGVDG